MRNPTSFPDKTVGICGSTLSTWADARMLTIDTKIAQAATTMTRLRNDTSASSEDVPPFDVPRRQVVGFRVVRTVVAALAATLLAVPVGVRAQPPSRLSD